MDVFKTLILDTPTAEGATGTVTSVDLTAGTGISVSGGPITSSGSITVTNTAPDQTVSIASGTGISVTGSYPSFTVTNSSPSLGGDVVGPASATDNAVVRFDSTTGKLIQNSGVSISDANLLTTTALTVNDNTILGSSNSDTVNFNARVSSEFTPATDNTYDLGRTGHEWRDLYIDGTANIDSLVADTADVNGGTIDGATIGATTPSTGAFTTLSATSTANNAGQVALLLQNADANSGIGSRLAWRLDNLANEWGYINVNRVGGGASSQMDFAVNSNAYSGAASVAMTILGASGNVGIGTTSPSYQLQLSTDSAAKPSTNTWTIASDSRIKNVTGDYSKGLDAVCALRPITYQYNGKAGFVDDGTQKISIIAQEAIEHFPECVGTYKAKLEVSDEQETELYNWNGHALTFALVNSVKELNAELQSLRARVAELEAKA